MREYDGQSGTLSLSRCTIERHSFHPKAFVLGHLTPSKKNRCDLNFLPIIELNNNLPPAGDIDIEMRESEELNEEGTYGQHGLKECQPRSRSQAYYEEEINEESMQQLIQHSENAEGCPVNDAGLTSTMEAELEIERTNNLLKMSYQSNGTIYEWEDDSKFNESWISFIQQYQREIHPVDVLEMKSIKIWYVHYPNETNPAASTHGCRICWKYYDVLFLDPNYKSEFAKEGGTLNIDIRENRKDILKHEKSSSHQMVIISLKRRAVAQLPLVLEDAQNRINVGKETGVSLPLSNEEVDLGPTSNHIRSVFEAICKFNVALDSYEQFVLFQRIQGSHLGCTYGNYDGASKTVAWLSNKFASNLYDNIKINSEKDIPLPISLILDESKYYPYY